MRAGAMRSRPTRRCRTDRSATRPALKHVRAATAAVARERARLRGQLKIYTAQGRVTGWVLCLMPFIMLGLLSSINWQFEKLLFTEGLGLHMCYFGLLLMVMGIFVIRKIIDVKI